MPAVASCERRLCVDVSKNSITAASSHDGAFDTSTTTDAPFIASANPSPVTEFTPNLGEASTASCFCSRNLVTTLDPISPLPPITTIFMIASLNATEAFQVSAGESLVSLRKAQWAYGGTIAVR